MERSVDLGPECHAVEFIQNGLLEPFAYPVGLRRLGLRLRVLCPLYV